MKTWACTGKKECEGTCERADLVEGPDGESTPQTEAKLVGEEKCSADGPPVRVHVEQTIRRGPNAGTRVRTFLVRRVVTHECLEIPQKQSEAKPLSPIGLTEAVLKAASRGPSAVKALCAGTDDARLALYTEQFAPTRVVIGSRHEQDRARVYAALKGELSRRRERPRVARPTPTEQLRARLEALGLRVKAIRVPRGYWSHREQDVTRWEADCIVEGIPRTIASWDSVTKCARRGFDLQKNERTMSGNWEAHAK